MTGMSGVGKSTALEGLALAGFATVDTDYGPWIHVVDGGPQWREALIDELFGRPRHARLFVAGTVANQGRFYDRFDAVVLLSAPIDTILQRLELRTNNPFGKTPDERRKIATDTAEIEPLLRQAATHEIDTSGAAAEVVSQLISIADELA
ncbi:shikimate kinase [Mycolicibacterium sp. CBMA 334]|uniref:shikimate kinase n=1 Tax=Mycolicibacterium sp. CBMA 334 TaxID=2606607 RepID=UPI0037C7E5F8